MKRLIVRLLDGGGGAGGCKASRINDLQTAE
jgi:hypothetical protein